MLLKSVHAQAYKSITDSGVFPVDKDVTCLVGKNESGKTAILETLYRVNPLPGHRQSFDGLRDYPRRLWVRERDRVPGKVPIVVEFQVEPHDFADVKEKYGGDVITAGTITAQKTYANKLTWPTWPFNEQALVARLVESAGVASQLTKGVTTVADLKKKLKTMADLPEPSAKFLTELEATDYRQDVLNLLWKETPRFLYFSDYSVMPGRVSIHKLQNTAEDELEPGERTALSLLKLAGVETEEFTQDDYEARKASLEAAAVHLSEEVFEFWSQNKSLKVQLDVDFHGPASALGKPPFLEVRIWNERHQMSLNFGERSQGFMWFFSFLAFFSEFRDSSDRLILLLDEPGLGLHAAAQADLLRFIDKRLAPEHQVIYTTHSPFMINSKRPERIRTVEDVDQQGTKVTADWLSTSKDTLFPLQAALGYDLAQTLFVGPDNLVVEGPADLVYFQVIGDYLASKGRTQLDPRWVVVPVGGMDKIPTFVALLGAQLDVAVVLDVATGGNQRINSLVERGIIAGERLLPLTEITKTPEADVEDLFEIGFYLDLLRRSGTSSVKATDLKSRGRIVKRIETCTGSKFDHYKPARYFLEHQVELLPKLSPDSLNRFEDLFKRANALLGPAAGAPVNKHPLKESQLVAPK